MRISPNWRSLGIAGACAGALFATLAAAQQSQEEKSVEARQGLMKLISWEAGPLFAMAKGDVPYDAAVAETRAQNLAALAQYAGHSLFLPDTSNAELGDKTRALPAIWEDQPKFEQSFHDLRDQTAVVLAEAGKGADQLRAAVGELGQVCGDCHEAFRQKN